MFKSQYLSFLIFLCLFLAGCSSGGDSASGSASSGSTVGGLTIETIPTAAAPSAQTMSKKGASAFAMYLLRLHSLEAELSLSNNRGSRVFDFLPLRISLANEFVPQDRCSANGSVSSRDATDLGVGYKTVSYRNCVTSYNPGEKAYFDGAVSFKYDKKSDGTANFNVRYQNFHTQFGQDQLSAFGGQRADQFNGSISMETDGNVWTINANVVLENNVDGSVKFDGIKIVHDFKGKVISASGVIGISGHGLFDISAKGGNLIIGSQTDSYLQIQFDGWDGGAFVDFYEQNGGVWGQYFPFSSVDEFDSRKKVVASLRFRLGDLARGIVKKIDSAIEDELYYLQGEIITIDLSKYYMALDGSLMDYSLELEAISIHTKVFGSRGGLNDPIIPVSDLPEISRPKIYLDETAAGRFSLKVDHLLGRRVELIFRPTVKGSTGVAVANSSTFKIYVIGDFDGDGIFDNKDDDDDNDGVLNSEDDLPYDPRSSSDIDGDGLGDLFDPDSDGDGVNNEDDYATLDPNCHLPYSAVDGVCFKPNIHLDPSFVGENGIALLRESFFSPVIFRYDIFSGAYYPPIILDQSLGNWRVSFNPKTDRIVLHSGVPGLLLLAENLPSAVELTPIEIATKSIDLLDSMAVATAGDYIFVKEAINPITGLQRAYLYSGQGVELSSIEADSSYISLCSEETRSFYQRCLFINGGMLQLQDQPGALLLSPGGQLFSPDFAYFAQVSKVFNKDGKQIYDFIYADQIIGWTEEGLIARNMSTVGIWDFEKGNFSKMASYNESRGGFFVTLKSGLYLVQLDDKGQVSSRKIEWANSIK